MKQAWAPIFWFLVHTPRLTFQEQTSPAQGHVHVHTQTLGLPPAWCSWLGESPSSSAPPTGVRARTALACRPPRPLPRGKHPLTHRLPHTASAEPSCIRQRCHSGRREERRVTSHPALGSSDKERRFWGAAKRGGETFIHCSPDSPPVWQWPRHQTVVYPQVFNNCSLGEKAKKP